MLHRWVYTGFMTNNVLLMSPTPYHSFTRQQPGITKVSQAFLLTVKNHPVIYPIMVNKPTFYLKAYPTTTVFISQANTKIFLEAILAMVAITSAISIGQQKIP